MSETIISETHFYNNMCDSTGTYQRRGHRGGLWNAVWPSTSCSDLHSARELPPGSSSVDLEFAKTFKIINVYEGRGKLYFNI